MVCEQIERELGRYVDNEMSAGERQEVDAHLEHCASCRAELEQLRELVGGIAGPAVVQVPDAVWDGIERRLHHVERSEASRPPARRLRFWGVPSAVAAAVLLAVGLGLFGLASPDTSVRASTVDFGVLLDALPLDAQRAFTKFLVRYDGKPTTPVAAKRFAPDLNFDTPPVLPGGFRLQSVYELRIGGAKGIAAAYDRNGEFLAVVFHPPMKHEKFGSHDDYQCMIGKHCGHKVQVGNWKLVHVTDPTTCHCLLSQLDERTEIPAVMRAVAPDLSAGAGGHTH